MLGKQRLAIGTPFEWLSIDLAARKELLWAIVAPFLLAVAFLSMMLLQEPSKGPISMDGQDVVAPAVTTDELFQPYSDWRQTDESYLPYRPVIR